MANKVFDRKHKEEKPVVAICYDFDKTLSPDDMQAQGYIQSVGFDIADFWRETNMLAEKNDMDQNLAYMLKMVKEAEGNLVFSRKTLAEYGSHVSLFPGVNDWFERIREYGKQKGVIVEHYIISSGLKEMIEGTEVARRGAFEKIYASSFYYNERGVAEWPAQVINYTNKTQFLFRIEKGVLDVNDPGVNDHFAPEDIRVPFRNMIYIGDSDTDVPCMKLVNSYGGHSIGVFNAETMDKTKVYKMMRDNRIKYYTPADYTDGSELDRLVKAIIDRTVTNEALETIHYECKHDHESHDMQSDLAEQKKTNLIIALTDSHSFARTHTVIEELSQYSHFSNEECEAIFKAAIKNTQVQCIILDPDLALFYTRLLGIYNGKSDSAKCIKKLLDGEIIDCKIGINANK